MKLIPQIIGILAVATFLLSYQQKQRKYIIFTNVISRCLYILQYLLLGAFAGAVLDVLGAVSSIVAGKKHTTFVYKYRKAILVGMNLCIILAGGTIALLNHSWLDLFSIAGVLLHTNAFWLNEESKIRIVSLLGSPCWFVYNFTSRAYGSAVGDVLTILSILIAMVKYRKSRGV